MRTTKLLLVVLLTMGVASMAEAKHKPPPAATALPQHHTITPNVASFNSPGVWTYGADVSSGEVMAGDGFTIFDFGGEVGGSIFAPAGWTAVEQLLGSVNGVPPPSGQTDNPALVNLLFTYTGSTPIGPVTVGRLALGNFGATTTLTGRDLGSWSSKDHAPDGSVGADHQDRILVPGNGNFPVPDGGGTVALLGIALTALEATRRLIRSRKG